MGLERVHGRQLLGLWFVVCRFEGRSAPSVNQSCQHAIPSPFTLLASGRKRWRLASLFPAAMSEASLACTSENNV